MSEYKDIEARIARVRKAHAAVVGTNATHGVSVGSAEDPQNGWFARVGNLVEYRPTIGGALVALEMTVRDLVEKKAAELRHLDGLLAELGEGSS